MDLYVVIIALQLILFALFGAISLVKVVCFVLVFSFGMLYLINCSFSEDHLKLSPYLPYLSGALAGFAATIGSYPFDLLRTILASQGEPKVYIDLHCAFGYLKYKLKIQPLICSSNTMSSIIFYQL